MTPGPQFQWPEGKRTAVLLSIAYEAWAEGAAPGIGPMGNPLPAGIPDLQARSWASYGPNDGIRRLMRILDRHDVRATVFASGCLAERAPDTIRDLHAAGHEVAAHSYTQDLLPGLLDENAERENIARCTDLLSDVTGESVAGWLSPRCTSSERTADLLAEAGYRWSGDYFDRDHPYVLDAGSTPFVAIPFTMSVNDLPHYVRHGGAPQQLYETFAKTLEYQLTVEELPAHIDVTAHAHVFGRPEGAWVFDQIVKAVAGEPDVWVPTRREVAQWTLNQRTVEADT